MIDLVDLVSAVLIVGALIVLVGFLANQISNKTGFPDVLILIFVGFLLGPVFAIFDPTSVQTFTPYIAALALSYIVFDGGMGLNIKQAYHNSPKAILLAILGFAFSVIGVTAFTVLMFNLPILYGLLFGVIFGGSSSVVVVTLVSKIRVSEKSATILVLESIITDIFSIVIAIAIIEVLITGSANIPDIGLGIASKFIIGLVVGTSLGLAWLFILRKVSSIPFPYMLTIGAVLLGYAGSEALGGSGVLCVLLMGLILGNEKASVKFCREKLTAKPDNGKIPLCVSQGLKRFGAEVAFLISTFFFVFLGMIATIPNLTILLIGIVLSVIMLLTRYGAVWLTTRKSELRKERGILTVVLTRGLATAVLATLPAQYGLLYSDLFIDITVIVIVITAIMATVGANLIIRKKITQTARAHSS